MPGTSSGGYLPPVVATFVANATDVETKIAEIKAELEDLSKTPTEVEITADDAPLKAALLDATGQLDIFKHTFGQMELELGLDFAAFEASLVAAKALADANPIDIPATIDMGPAIAKFALGAALMRAIADKAGGGAGGGGLLGLLGWGGGAFGAAAFGSVLSLAGFGFEHLITTVLGLAGSLAGALAGAAVLAGGALLKLSVGMGSDILVANEARQAVAALVAGIEASPTSSPAVQALAALEAGTLTLAQATLVYGKAAAQAQYQTAQLTIATDLYWLHSISPALIQLAQLKDSLLGLAQIYIPLIADAATKNFALIQVGLQPLLSWLEGPSGIGIFKNLEAMFATELPSALMAFDNGVELLLKILDYAAGYTGKFIENLALLLLKWNTSPPTVWQHWVNDIIGLFDTWWALLKQVGITIYDIFVKSAGLGTSIVQIITQMLVQLDKWLGSTSTSNASVHNLFEVHLQEVEALLRLIPLVATSFGALYLVLAPALTQLVTWIADFLGFVAKIPVAGPLIAWGLAIAFFWSKMKIAVIGSSLIVGMRSMMLAAQGISAAFSAGGMLNGLNALKSFFAGGNWGNFFGSGSANNIALDANTAALNRLTAVMGGEAIGGGVGGAAAGAGSAAGGIAGLETGIIGLGTGLDAILAVTGPLAIGLGALVGTIAILNAVSSHPQTGQLHGSPIPQGPGTGGTLAGVAGIQQAYAATWSALLNSSNAAYKTSALFQQNLQTDLTAAGVPISQVPADAALIAKEFANGQITSQAQLATIIQGLAKTAVVTGGAAQAALLFSQLQQHNVSLTGPLLANFEGSWGQIARTGQSMSMVQGALLNVINHAGVTSPTQINTFLSEWASLNLTGSQANAAYALIDAGIRNGSLKNPAQVMALLTNWGAIVTETGKTNISSAQLAQFAALATLSGQAFSNSMYSLASQMHVPMNSILAAFMRSASESNAIAQSLANFNATINAQIAALNKSNPGTYGLTGHGRGFITPYAAGGILTEPVIGYGTRTGKGYSFAELGPEAVVPMSAANSNLGMSSVPAGVGGGGGGGAIMVNVGGVNVTVPPGTPTAIAQQVGAQTADVVNVAVNRAIRLMKGGARTYGFVPS